MEAMKYLTSNVILEYWLWEGNQFFKEGAEFNKIDDEVVYDIIEAFPDNLILNLGGKENVDGILHSLIHGKDEKFFFTTLRHVSGYDYIFGIKPSNFFSGDWVLACHLDEYPDLFKIGVYMDVIGLDNGR
jgi:hypothetical protein